MADITNAQAVKFSNEKIRVAANKLAQSFSFAKQVIAEWNAHGGSALIANSADDTIIDGSATDGRPVIDGADANNIINRLTEIVADYEASGSAKLNTILQVAPNPGD